MALEVHVYTVEARKRDETPYPACDYHTQDYEEAERYAAENKLMVIDNTYEWNDSEMVDDFTEDSDSGPPQRCANCGAREGEDCRTWCAYKPSGLPMAALQQEA
jgi:hypothetical protein